MKKQVHTSSLIFALALALLAVIGVLVYRSISNLIETVDWVAHTHQVKEGLHQILSQATQAQSSGRGYVITGDPEYLNPYRDVAGPLAEGVARLKSLTEDTPASKVASTG